MKALILLLLCLGKFQFFEDRFVTVHTDQVVTIEYSKVESRRHGRDRSKSRGDRNRRKGKSGNDESWHERN